MLRTPLATLLVVPVLLVAAACSGGDDDPGTGASATAPPSATPVADVDLSGSWTLDQGEVDGAPLDLGGAAVTLVVDGDKATGQATCNTYDLTVTTEGTAVDFGGGELGGKTCAPGGDEADLSYLQALAGTATGEVTGSSLVLTSPTSTLTFSAS